MISPWDMVESKVSNEILSGKNQTSKNFQECTISTIKIHISSGLKSEKVQFRDYFEKVFQTERL